MTGLREAAQMALNALEYPGPSWLESRQKAAEALRAALAQPEQRTGNCLLTGVCAAEGHRIQKAQPEQEPVWGDSQVTKPEVIAAQKAMNEGLRNMVEPEPVAWMYDWYDETEDIDGVPIGGIVSDCISKDYDEAHSPTMGCHNIRPLYTAPPQRKFIGLTDEELLDIADMAYANDLELLQTLQAKLKEKNGG